MKSRNIVNSTEQETLPGQCPNCGELCINWMTTIHKQKCTGKK